jgi:hypothetical protein
MSSFYGVNYTKAYQDVSPGKVAPGEYNGNVKVMYDEYVFDGDVYSISDKIYLGKLPKNARILGCHLKCEDLGGSTGIFTIGTADATTGLVVAADAGGQAVNADGAGALIGTRLTEEEAVYATFTEATDDADACTLRFWVYYIVD